MRHDAVREAAIRGMAVCDIGAAADMLAPLFRALDHEQVHALHLDADLLLIGHVAYATGTAGVVDVPLRRLFRDALDLDARALILAHNHPGGDLHPSRADREATRRIVDIARPLGITALDHLIFAGGNWASLRRAGLM